MSKTHLPLNISHLPNNLDQLPHLQMRIGLQDQRHVSIISTRDGRRVAAESCYCAQYTDGVCDVGVCVGGVEGVEVGGEDAGCLEGHFVFLSFGLLIRLVGIEAMDCCLGERLGLYRVIRWRESVEWILLIDRWVSFSSDDRRISISARDAWSCD